MATANDNASHPARKPAPIPCIVLSGEPLNGLLAVDSEGPRVALDLQVPSERCVYIILEQDTAIDLALRLTGAVMRQRRAERPKFAVPGASIPGAPVRFDGGVPRIPPPR